MWRTDAPAHRPREALEQFSERRGAEAVALVEISWGCDRPGTLGMVRFIGPIVLDKIFSNALPQLFSPPILQKLRMEDENSGFQASQGRKRYERAGQIAIISTTLAAAGSAVAAGVHAVGSLL
ncbi:hypothetical protein T484DRAFT_1791728 [Baffinella frigidus]|nr:hypothetical protein T484DRAFT_1791728 [Cryptophyta sp. CCMP2293]